MKLGAAPCRFLVVAERLRFLVRFVIQVGRLSTNCQATRTTLWLRRDTSFGAHHIGGSRVGKLLLLVGLLRFFGVIFILGLCFYNAVALFNLRAILFVLIVVVVCYVMLVFKYLKRRDCCLFKLEIL